MKNKFDNIQKHLKEISSELLNQKLRTKDHFKKRKLK